jgi:multidrug efflux system membrane fusion protein
MTFSQSSLRFAFFAILLSFGPGGVLLADPWLASAPAGREPLPTISVEATYPGASAQVVADAVAAPIEQQVLGTEGLARTFSRSAGDGTYVLDLMFQRGVDLNAARTLVQNRASLALPILPDPVKNAGVAVEKKSPGPLMLAVLFSPDASRDVLYLGNYAAIQIKDELARVPGVARAALFGAGEYGMRIWLDPEKMAALGLTGADVIRAIGQQNVEVAAGETGPAPAKGTSAPISVKALGRLAGPDDFAGVVIKAGDGGRVVRIRDVARVELGSCGPWSHARLDGMPAVVLAIYPVPQARLPEVSAAAGHKLSELKSLFPRGIDVSTPLDFTAGRQFSGPSAPPAYLLIEVALPAGASAERIEVVLNRCQVLLKSTEGVENVLELSENPFGLGGRQPCLVARLAAADVRQARREDLMRTIRDRLTHVPEAAFRLCDLSSPSGYPPAGFPIDLAISGPEDGPVREVGQRVVERLRQGRKLTDVGWDPRYAPAPHLDVDVDRAKAAALGVSLSDLFDTLQVFLGSREAGHFSRFGRTWQVRVEVDANHRGRAGDIGQLKVRSSQGKMIPLASLATIRETTGAEVLDRLDGRPTVEITANPAPGVSLAEARWLCETAAEEVRLAAEYRLTWLAELPPPKPVAGAGAVPKSVAAHSPPEVAVAVPVVRQIEDYVECPGRTQAVSTVDLRARVSGYLVGVYFKEGSDIKKGDVLFEIDSRPYQAECAKAEAEALRADARRQRAQAAVRRAERLVVAKAMSQEDLDQLQGELEDAQAAIRVARAGLDAAKLNLDFAKVVAPIDGRIGRCLVTPGNLVKADETLLATIVSRDPMFVYFDLDERTMLRLMRDSRRLAAIPAQLGLADEEGYSHKGTVDFADNRVDADTGTLKVRAIFPNADGTLVPGLFARIRLAVGAPRRALLVPERAIQADQGEKFLYVLDDQDKVVRRSVTVAAAQDGLRVVEKGLQAGERVVIDGLQNVLPGTAVTPRLEPCK